MSNGVSFFVSFPISTHNTIALQDDVELYEVTFNTMQMLVVPPSPSYVITPSSVIYVPTDDSYVSAIFTPNDGAAVLTAEFAAALTVKDVISPSFSPCPDDITVLAASGAVSANVSWATPQLFDNAPIVQQSNNYSPGDVFLIENSPYTVFYQAVDVGGNSGTCKFTVSVTYTPMGQSSEIELNANSLSASLSNATLRTYGINVPLINSSSIGTSLDFDVATPSSYNQINITVTSPTNRYEVINRTDTLTTRVEVDLIWTVNNYTRQGAGTPNTFTTLQFLDAYNSSYPADGSELDISQSWFESSSQTTLESGKYLRMKGAGDFTSIGHVSFSSFVVALNFPAFATLSGAYKLQSQSYIRFSTYTLDSAINPSTGAGIRIVDTEPPVIHNCPASQTYYASNFLNHAVSVVNWVAPTATDNRFVVI